jgi:hypothetical protein
MRRLGLLVALALGAPAGTAGAQPSDGDSTGFLGKRPLRLEIDDCPVLPDLDEPARLDVASEHYERGAVLHYQGDYEGAVREFVSSLCLAPREFGAALKSIGQAYERLLEFERAIAYFERYVLSRRGDSAEDARERRSFAERIQVLQRLRAKVQVATSPPGAVVSFTDEMGVRQASARSDGDPFEITAGTYTMRIEHAGYEPIEQDIETAIGKPYSFFFLLEPRRGRLVINAQPADARIFVDDRLVAIGRYDDRLPGGTYEVTVEAADRVPEKRRIEVIADRDTDLPIRLPPRPASGRTQLLIGTSVAGGLIGSVALGVLEDDRTSRAGLGFLGGIGLGFAGGYFGIPDRIEVGTSSYILTASAIGAAEAGLVASLFDEGAEVTGPVAIGGMAAGAIFASLTASRFRFDAGDAALLNSGALWGAIGGGLFAAVFEFRPRVGEALVLGGMNLGIVGGVLLGGQLDYSRRHVALIDLAGLAGMGLSVAALSVIDRSGDGDTATERTAHFALGGMAGGLALGALLTRNLDVPAVQGVAPTLTTGSDPAGGRTRVLGLTGAF